MKQGAKGVLGLSVIVGAFLLGGEMDYRDQVNEVKIKATAEAEAKHSCNADRQLVKAFRKTCNLIAGEGR